MKNVKSIADEVEKLNDLGFESFIAEQILSAKSSFVEEPCFSIVHRDMTIDIWKKNSNFEFVKSVIPGATKKAGKDFRKVMKKEDIIKEINEILNNFLD